MSPTSSRSPEIPQRIFPPRPGVFQEDSRCEWKENNIKCQCLKAIVARYPPPIKKNQQYKNMVCIQLRSPKRGGNPQSPKSLQISCPLCPVEQGCGAMMPCKQPAAKYSNSINVKNVLQQKKQIVKKRK